MLILVNTSMNDRYSECVIQCTAHAFHWTRTNHASVGNVTNKSHT